MLRLVSKYQFLRFQIISGEMGSGTSSQRFCDGGSESGSRRSRSMVSACCIIVNVFVESLDKIPLSAVADRDDNIGIIASHASM